MTRIKSLEIERVEDWEELKVERCIASEPTSLAFLDIFFKAY